MVTSLLSSGRGAEGKGPFTARKGGYSGAIFSEGRILSSSGDSLGYFQKHKGIFHKTFLSLETDSDTLSWGNSAVGGGLFLL